LERCRKRPEQEALNAFEYGDVETMTAADLFGKIEKIKMVYRILILVGTVLILGGLFIWLVYIPKTEEIAKISKQNTALRQKIGEAKNKAQDLPKFRTDQVQVDAQFQEALTLLPKKEEIPSLLRNITELGENSNLEFKVFSPKKGASKDFFMEIPVSIQVAGKYHDGLLFFDRVGKMKRIVNIQDVSMSPMGDSAMLNVNCKAITYRFVEKGGAGGAGKARKKK